VIAPCTWVAVEFVRGEIFLSGYAAGLLAYPLVQVPGMASPAAWLGVYFVSFLVAAVTCAVFARLTLSERSRTPSIATLTCAVVVWAVAWAQLDARARHQGTGTLTPGVVQTNLPQSNKISWGPERELEDMDRFGALTLQLAASEPKPDFILWPETMTPGETLEWQALQALLNDQIGLRMKDGRLLRPDHFYEAMLALQSQVQVPMLVGEDALVGVRISRQQERIRLDKDARYNSAYLLDKGAVQPARYDKVRLTPFGETMPVISRWPWLQNQLLAFGAQGMSFDLNAGQSLTVFDIPVASGEPVRVVAPICFEVMVSDHCRKLVFDGGHRRAEVIANLTNDGWFGDSDIAREKILQVARWRCIELATPMARAANTGISCFIDAQGRVIARGVEGATQSSKVDGILRAAIARGMGSTLYGRVGNLFPVALLVLCAIALGASFVRRKVPAPAGDTRTNR
jgi:apolipoprotein N-acyltransferase